MRISTFHPRVPVNRREAGKMWAKTFVAAAQADDFHLLCPGPCWNVTCDAHHETSRTAQLDMACPANVLNETPETQLIGDARNGNRDAITELFRRHYAHSIAVARRILPAQEEFLDAVQSAYLSAFRNFQSFRGDASFKTWITRIVLNQCLMRLRRRRWCRFGLSLDLLERTGAPPSVAEDSPSPENLALRAEMESTVAKAVSKLPGPLRDVFTRCGVSGLTMRDTADALGLTVPATKTRLFRARLQLRQELQKALGDGLTSTAPGLVSGRNRKSK
jgi:RNA polymerase sigma-70 factor (ECF subfamily)